MEDGSTFGRKINDTSKIKNFFIVRYNIITVMFLGLFDIPNIGTKWLSYVLPISCFAVIPLFLLVKEEYNRRSVDEDDSDQ